MKKLLLVSLCVLFYSLQIFAQNRTVTGTVIAKEDGGPIPGVGVKVKGTTLGVVTGADGKYSISVPSSATTLVFSFIGYATQEKAISGSSVNVTMELSSKQLGEIEITSAYGIKQTARSGTNAAQLVTGSELNTVRQSNINNALAGKVAGLQVRSQSPAALGRNTEVRLRGASGFGTGRGAIYVVDGTVLPNSDDLNPDDIESVSVLQGAAAGAIFGSMGANGAIVITTKKAEKNAGLNVTLNLGVKFDKAYVLPNYQNTYGGGNNPDLTQYVWKAGDPVEWQALSGKYYPDYSDDSSWGPKMVGQEYIPWYAWYGGTQYSYKTASFTPQPDNASQFFQTGVTSNNSVTLSKAGADYNVKFSYNNQYIKGLVPTSDLQRNVMNLNYSYDLNKHLTFSTSINYINQKTDGLVNDAYSNQTSGSFDQWFHRDLDMNIVKELRGLRTPSGVYASWNHSDPNTYDPSKPDAFYAGNYWYNFYTYQDLINVVNERDRLYGNVALTYKLNNDLSFRGTYRKQQNTTYGSSIFSSDLFTSQTQATGNEARNKGYYSTTNTYSNRQNFEFLATYTKKIKDLNINANVGTDSFKSYQTDNSANTNNGLSIPNLYTINNSADAPTYTNNRITEKYNAVFGKLSLGYKDLLFVDGTLRNDWFSTLPQDHNSVLSRSIGASFVFTDLFKGHLNWLTFGKIRASYGEIPQALGTTNETFGFGRYPGAAYGVAAVKYNGNLLMSTPDQITDAEIKGATRKEKELGIDLRFLNDKLGLSATYWDGSESGIPGNVTVNGASGFTSVLTNFGLITKKGIDVNLSATPVSIKNFSWSINATWGRILSNNVDEISKKYDIHRITVASNYGTTAPQLILQEGMEWGQIYGNGIKRNADGVPILSATGFYQNDPNVYFGSVIPNFTGGVQNSFTLFKNFSLNVNIDYQSGGKFFSVSDMWGSYSGLTARTAALNDKGNPVRDAPADGGGVHTVGVNAAGQPVSYYVPAFDYYTNMWNNKTFDDYVYDLTFIKLREIGLRYRIPVKQLGITKAIRSASFQITGTDLFILYAKTKDFDPSQISGLQGEQGQLPGTRGLGFNLTIGF
jgi:TonB-linked SusC/RagA family outer membrane protein